MRTEIVCNTKLGQSAQEKMTIVETCTVVCIFWLGHLYGL